MNRKTLASTVALLVCIAMIGVGYAAWLLTPPVPDVNADTTVSVSTVNTNELALTASVVAESGKTQPINLGADADENGNIKQYDYSWVTFDETEDLELQIQVVLAPEKQDFSTWAANNKNGQIQIWLSRFSALNKSNTVVQGYADYVLVPAIEASNASALVSCSSDVWSATLQGSQGNQSYGWKAASFDATSGTLTLTFKLRWGSAFAIGGTNYNPNYYFNTQETYNTNFQTKANALASIAKFDVQLKGALTYV